MGKIVRNYYGIEIPWSVVEKSVMCYDTRELAQRVWEDGDQEPQAFFNNFCRAYEEETGDEFWLFGRSPKF